MKPKFIEALEQKHPGYEVIDVKFALEPGVTGDIEITDEIDQELADAIRDAEQVDISTLM
jgi:hypothetical protein